MAGSHDEQVAACDYLPFTEADASGYEGVFRIGVTTANQVFDVPIGMRGKWVDIYATVDTQIGISRTNTGAVLVYNQLSALGAGHVAAGRTIPAGVIKPVRMRMAALKLSVIGSAAGFLEIVPSEKP